jgi:hypothetical protein
MGVGASGGGSSMALPMLPPAEHSSPALSSGVMQVLDDPGADHDTELMQFTDSLLS